MKRALWIAAVAQFVFCTFGFGQSLADAARKERERQNQTKSKIVISNSVTGIAATTSATTSSTAAKPAPAPAAKAAELTDNQGHNEKYWRSAFQKARDDAKRAEDRSLVLELKLKDLNAQLLNRSDIYNKENVLGQQITATEKELAAAKKAAAEAKQKLTNLDEELRKSGGPAGWAR
jgi:hypothetical protein